MSDTKPSMVCPKCSGRMEFGLLVDSMHSFGASARTGPERVLEWVRGIPRKRWFDLRFKTGKEDRKQVATLRCTGCGFLELYVPDEAAAENRAG